MFTRSASVAFILATCLCLTNCGAVADQGVRRAADVAVERMGHVVESELERTASAAADLATLWQLDATERASFRAFEEVQPKARWRVFTTKEVKTFVRSFEEGFRDPDQHLRTSGADPVFLRKWLQTPQQDRVFVAGSKEDSTLVASLQAKLEQKGKTVFFYKSCAAAPDVLCKSSGVGAFFATAGLAFVTATPESVGSRFIPDEVAAALNLHSGGKALLLVTPAEILSTAANNSGATIVSAKIGNS